MNTSPVCFGSSGKTYGNFTIPETGHVITVKLVYRSGYVNCQVSDSQYRSKWGCPYLASPNNLAVFITDSQQQRILPTDKASFYGGPWCLATHSCTGFLELPRSHLNWDFIIFLFLWPLVPVRSCKHGTPKICMTALRGIMKDKHVLTCLDCMCDRFNYKRKHVGRNSVLS